MENEILNETETNTNSNDAEQFEQELKVQAEQNSLRVSEDVSTPPEKEEPKTPTERPDWLPDRFKTVEDLLKRTKELEGKMRHGAKEGDEGDEVDPENLVPEKYEFPDTEDGQTFLESVGLEIHDQEAFDTILEDFKNDGYTQKQVNTALKRGGEWVNAIVASYGPMANVEEQKKMFKEELGDKADDTVNAVNDWASSNLHRDVYTKPLTHTKEGLKFLNSLRTENNIKPINAAPVNRSADDINDEVDKLMSDKRYYGHGKTSQDLNQRVSKLLSQLERIKG